MGAGNKLTVFRKRSIWHVELPSNISVLSGKGGRVHRFVVLKSFSWNQIGEDSVCKRPPGWKSGLRVEGSRGIRKKRKKERKKEKSSSWLWRSNHGAANFRPSSTVISSQHSKYEAQQRTSDFYPPIESNAPYCIATDETFAYPSTC